MNRISFLLFIGLMIGAMGCGGGEPTVPGASATVTPFMEVNSDMGEGWITFNADGDRMVFGRHDSESWSHHTLYEAVRTDSGWSAPEVLPFSGTYNDRAARFYPGVNALLFSSDRPPQDRPAADDFNLWTAAWDGEAWTEPIMIESISSIKNEFHGSAAADGTLYFASDKEGGAGRSDLYRAVLGNTGYQIKEFPGPVNTEYSEADIFVAPDQSYVIFSRTDDPRGYGGDDLYISWAIQGGWFSAAQNLGPAVNSAEYEYGAFVADDGDTLYFTSHRDGDADIYTVSLNELNLTPPTAALLEK